MLLDEIKKKMLKLWWKLVVGKKVELIRSFLQYLLGVIENQYKINF